MISYNYRSALIIYGRGKGGGNIIIRKYVGDILEPHILPRF